MTGRRLDRGGRIDRSRTWSLTFMDTDTDGGTELTGHPGDTLASALLANGYRAVTRSIHAGRPRGIVSAGEEEPGSLVQVESVVGGSGVGEPSRRATRVELHDGLRARPLAGKGVLPETEDTARNDHRYVHCDVLVVGAGPAGLAAALAAGRTGARVVLADDQPEPGGSLLGQRATLDAAPAVDWVTRVAAELAQLDEVAVLDRATVVGYYDHNELLAFQRRTDHLGDAAPAHKARHRVWHLRAKQVVLATGAHERPLVFVDNDLPGVMLAGSAAAYANRWGVAVGERAVVATVADSAYTAALDLLDAGIEVAAVIDARSEAGPVADAVRDRGVEVRLRSAVVQATGEGAVAGALVASLDAPESEPVAYTADVLAVCGGWSPVVHLFSQSGGRLRYDDGLAAYTPAHSVQAERSVGAAGGTFGLSGSIAEGAVAGRQAAAAAGCDEEAEPVVVPADDAPVSAPPAALWRVTDRDEERQYVDLERDATVADIRRAVGAGLSSVQHVKRYTTIGTGSDQGRTSGVVANGVLADLLGTTPGVVGTTTYRPPYVPVPFSALAGRSRGDLLDPIRTTPMHPWHVAHGAVFEDVGQWKRPFAFPRHGEDVDAAVLRESAAARTAVGAIDATTLGKIEVVGPDAPEFLNRMYTNGVAKLPVGSIRYGVIVGVDGMILDDGVMARLAEDRYLVSTTTGNAATVLDWFEEWLQTEWPDLQVFCTSVTEQWAVTAVVGPRSREVVAALLDGELDLSPEAFPFMTFRDATVAGIPTRIMRVSFSGELAYELHVPAACGLASWEAVMAAGEPHGITPYGTETMHVLRAEKGYLIVGQDTDGTVTPGDAGLGWAVSTRKDFVGKRSLDRVDTSRADRKQLVGLLPVDPTVRLDEGAQLIAAPPERPPTPTDRVPMLGHVTSSYASAELGRTFALGLLTAGRSRHGDRLHAASGDRVDEVEVTGIALVDPEGARRDG